MHLSSVKLNRISNTFKRPLPPDIAQLIFLILFPKFEAMEKLKIVLFIGYVLITSESVSSISAMDNNFFKTFVNIFFSFVSCSFIVNIRDNNVCSSGTTHSFLTALTLILLNILLSMSINCNLAKKRCNDKKIYFNTSTYFSML